MSSLRLALKQSLAETGTLVNEEQKEKERKRKKELARKRREQQRLLQLSRKRKKKKRRSRSEDDQDGGGASDSSSDDDESSLSSSSSSESSSGSDDDDSSTSSGVSGDSSSDEDDDDDSSSDESSDGSDSSSSSSSEEENNVDMGGVFDSEQSSSSDEEGDRRPNKKLQKRGRGGKRGKSPSKKGGVRKRKAVPRGAAGGSSVSSSQKKKGGDGGGAAVGGSKKSSVGGSSTKQQTCPPPDPEITAYVRQMPILDQRKNVERGLRVKVRFVTKSSKRGKDGKAIRKLKWYGGVVTDIATGGKRIRIKYDDGTSEVADFPDKDIVVDEVGNGQHKHGTKPEQFLPPPPQKRRTPSPRAPLSVEFEKKVEKPKPRKTSSSDNRADLTSDEIEQLQQHKRSKSSSSTAGPHPGDKQSKHGRTYSMADASTADKKRRTHTPTGDGDGVAKEKDAAAAAGAADKIRPPSSPSSSSGSSSSSSSSSSSEEKRRKKKKDAAKKKKRKRSDAAEVPTTVATKSKKKSSNDAMELALERAAARLEGKESSQASSEPTKPASEKIIKSDEANANTPTMEDSAKDNASPMESDDKKESSSARVVTTDYVEDTVMSESAAPSSKKRAVSPSAAGAADEPPRKKATTEDKDKDSSHQRSAQSSDNKSTKPEPAQGTEVASSKSNSVFCSYKEKTPTASSAETKDAKEGKEKEKADDRGIAEDKKAKVAAVENTSFEMKAPGSGDVKGTTDAPQSGNIENESKQAAPASSATKEVVVDTVDGKFQAGEKGGATSSTPPTEEEARLSPGPSPNEGNKPKKKIALPPIQRSGRRAAQKANELIVSKEERIIKDGSAKPKGKRKEDLKIKRSSSKASDDDDDDDDDDSTKGEDGDHWAQCDQCQKWRLLPTTVDMETLPERWFCEMNTFDPKRNICAAPEQSAQEAAKEKKKTAKEAARRKKLASSSPRPPKGATKSPVPDAAKSQGVDDELKKGAEAEDASTSERRPSGQKGKRRSPHTIESNVTRASSDKAVVSSKPRSDVKSDDGVKLPGVAIQAKKSRQKSGGGDASAAAGGDGAGDAVSQSSKPKGSSRNRNKPKSGKDSDKDKKKSSKGKKGGKKSKNDDDEEDPDNVEWVQCEKCEKWRKLPPHISAEDLPEVWYCNMNTWDPDTASCGVEEDKMDSSHREFQIMGEGGTFTTSFGSSGKLSYRNLIFGTKGKQNRPLSERQRAVDSLFSYQPLDPLGMAAGPPMCMYSNSSAFFHRGFNQQKAAAEEANRVSFFDVMIQSRLWDELYRGARAMQSLTIDEENTDGPASTHVGSMTEEMYVRSMKALIYHALGTKTLAGHEVLLEAQCRQWDDAQWAELRASCTIEVVTHALNLLAKDGLVQATMDVTTGTVQYRRTNIDGLPTGGDNAASGAATGTAINCTTNSAGADADGNNVDLKKQESRCMKIAKPWKRNKSLA